MGRSVARLAPAAVLAFLLVGARADELAELAPPPVATQAVAGTALPVGAAAGALGMPSAPLAAIPPRVGPKIAIIIDDLGYRFAEGQRAVRLPGPVAVAILPHTPYAAGLASEADSRGKEIVLHVPMEALEAELLGPGALELDQTRSELAGALAADLAAVPLALAVSNHMGSSLTREAVPMRWIMEELKSRETLFFVDSYTTADSVALQAAREAGVRALRRDVFLDGDQTPAAVQREWLRLLARARERGFALAIGHPHAATLEFLERALPALAASGVALVPLADLLDAEPAAAERR
jgi:polysaccharide deacetylase 2 family uncharacterized protein YibQ